MLPCSSATSLLGNIHRRPALCNSNILFNNLFCSLQQPHTSFFVLQQSHTSSFVHFNNHTPPPLFSSTTTHLLLCSLQQPHTSSFVLFNNHTPPPLFSSTTTHLLLCSLQQPYTLFTSTIKMLRLFCVFLKISLPPNGFLLFCSLRNFGLQDHFELLTLPVCCDYNRC